MSSQPHPVPNHRLTRLALWLLAMLAWFVLGRRGDERQRRRAEISFEKIECAVRNVILAYAAQFVPPRKPKPRRHCAHKPPRLRLRAVAGSWLRRRLRTRGDLVTRAVQLLAALRNWRELAAGLGRRRARGMTRLVRILFVDDRATPLRASAAIAPYATDTS